MLYTPPADLYDRIIKRINKEQKLAILKRKLFYYFLGLSLSLAVLIPLGVKLRSEIVQSGIINYLSLIFTDFEIISANLKDYGLSLLEALPVFIITLIAFSFLVFIFYLGKFINSIFDLRKININI